MADELVLGGQRVLPGCPSASGYAFAHPELDEAVALGAGARQVTSGQRPRIRWSEPGTRDVAAGPTP